MGQNAIYVCISWYCKICWFLMENDGVSRNQEVFYVIHIFFGFSLGNLWLLSFMIIGYDRYKGGERDFLDPHPWAALKGLKG